LCNLRCSYCNAWREGPNQIMPMDVVERTTKEALQLPWMRKVDFAWHGGETTLLKVDYFYRALEFQSKYRGDRIVENIIQTNATLLDDKWISIFKDGNFQVGVSIDPPPERHARERKTKGGRDSWQATIDGIRQLEAAHIRYGALVVVNEELLDYGAERFLACLAEYGLTSVGLLNVVPDNRDPSKKEPNYLGWNSFVQFLIDVYFAKQERYRHLRIRELDSLVDNIVKGVPSICIYAGNCMGQYVTVEPSGEVKACDKYVYDNEYSFGELAASSLADILTGPAVASTRQEYFEQLEPLKECQYFKYCNGGCPHDQYLRRRVDSSTEIRCCGLAPLVEVMLRGHQEKCAGQ